MDSLSTIQIYAEVNMGSGSAPPKTAEQKAIERQQREALDEEKASSERRLKAIAQKKIGKASLLGQPMEQAKAPEGPTITKGYQMSEGNLVKTPSTFSRFLNTALGASAMSKGVKAGSLIGKATGKRVRTGRMDK